MKYVAHHCVRVLLLGLTIVIAASISHAAEIPSDFADVRWGASTSNVKQTLARRPGVEFVEETPSRMVFRGGAFADYPAERWVLDFGPKGFWRGTVYLTIPTGNAPDGAPLRNRQFDNLAASLTKKYGKPSPLPRAASAAEAIWKLTDPSTGRKGAYSVFLRYSWAPREFLIRYSYDPSTAQSGPTPPGSTGKKDL